ncbi:response regulator [Salinarimonas soli]|uniref:Response regulator n=2 Tax=Salinarimonas soli TaxID=1638099 RepID=A0A5B2VQY4_9HYPH|nr:response regulator [Salinarimonas soli]
MTMIETKDWNGLRVLVVEDEAMVSMLVEDMLLDLGCEIVGPAARIPAALDLASSAEIDAAVLDVNVAGQAIWPVADALSARGVPIVFTTGYGESGLQGAYVSHDVVQKPFQIDDLVRALSASLEKSAAR